MAALHATDWVPCSSRPPAPCRTCQHAASRHRPFLANAKASPARMTVVVGSADYSFAQVEPKELGRHFRGRDKRQARNLRDLVDGLCHMTEKQLKAATPLCGAPIIDAVRIAARIPRTNQGRKRQESLVVKLLRTQLDEKALDKVQEAVELSRTGSNAYVDRDIQARVDAWREGLLEGDQDVLREVLTLLAAHSGRTDSGQPAPAASEDDDTSSDGFIALDTDSGSGSETDGETSDGSGGGAGVSGAGAAGAGATRQVLVMSPQELRTLVRQCQTAAAEARQLQAEVQGTAGLTGYAASSPSPSLQAADGSSGAVEGDDDEGLEQVLRQAAARARRSSKGPAGGQEGRPGKGGAGVAGVGGVVAARPVDLQAAGRRNRQLTRMLNATLKQLAASA